MKTPTFERLHRRDPAGVQKLYRFPNGYGASVIRTQSSYGGRSGLWELAVIKYCGDGIDAFHLTYETPITDDVVGYLTDEEVDKLLTQVEELK